MSEHLTTAELRGMLRLRRAELQQQIASDASRLAQVEVRLQAIENEASELPSVVVKSIAAVLVAELTGVAAGYEPQFITPVIRPLYHELPGLLCEAGIAITGPGVAYYGDSGDDAGTIDVHAALPVAASLPGGQHAFSVVELSEIPAAATLIHHGSMDEVLSSIQALARWIDAHGYQSLGYPREVTLKFSDERDDWVTELQEPIAVK
jgi:effector-binding domain-containing protein